MSNKKSGILKNVVVLLAVTFVSVLLLAVVNQVTARPIALAEIEARNAVYQMVFEDAKNFSEIKNLDKLIEEHSKKSSSVCTINDAMTALDENSQEIGFVIAATSPNGYGGDIQIAVGITNNGVITDFSVVSHSETAGLGSNATKPEFSSQFSGKPAQELEYTKTGAKEENQIDAISGATITTNAVTQATNAAIEFYNNVLKGE